MAVTVVGLVTNGTVCLGPAGQLGRDSVADAGRTTPDEGPFPLPPHAERATGQHRRVPLLARDLSGDAVPFEPRGHDQRLAGEGYAGEPAGPRDDGCGVACQQLIDGELAGHAPSAQAMHDGLVEPGPRRE